jgi:hypothetical protein
MGQIKSAYIILVWKHERNRPLGKYSVGGRIILKLILK